MAKYILAMVTLTSIVLLVALRPRAKTPPVAVEAPPIGSCTAAAAAACESSPPVVARPAPPRPSAAAAKPRTAPGAAIAAAPFADARVQRALELFHEGRKDAALQLLEALVRAEPANSQALAELGMLYALDPATMDRARELFRKALDADPENIAAVDELYRLDVSRRGLGAAVETLSDAARRHPDSGNVAGAYGRALAEQGRLAEALPHLQRAAREPNPSMEVQAALAAAYEGRGDARGQAEALRSLVAAQERFLARNAGDAEVAHGTRREIVQNTLTLARALIVTRDFDGAESLLRSAAERQAAPQDLERLYQELQRARGGA